MNPKPGLCVEPLGIWLFCWVGVEGRGSLGVGGDALYMGTRGRCPPASQDRTRTGATKHRRERNTRHTHTNHSYLYTPTHR